MSDQRQRKARDGPAITVVIGIVGLLLGLGRCGFFKPAMRPADDYGISGAVFFFVGFGLFVGGIFWFLDRRRM
ncbi:MAG TPA: hypothetical protein VGM11_10100 [Acidobacteriaceae bacterium]|jgi:hypothetical protein